MSETAPARWDDVVEALQRDIAVVMGGATGEEAAAAIDEAWAIVDAFEERAGDVDVDRIAAVLGVDPETADAPIEQSSIPSAFVVDDPERAAALSRLVSLINLDAATDYDVGRLWHGGDDGTGSDGPPGGRGSRSDPPDATSTAERDETDEIADELRSKLGEALDEFKGQITEARDRVDGSAGGQADDRSTERGDHRSSRSARRLSTVPADRADVGGLPHVSTVPDRG